MQSSQVFHPANERGHVAIDWLESQHSFSFGQYYNPEKMGFGALRVINDDTIAPARGFGTHPHRDMEIITIPLEGEVLHKDSLGTAGTISSNEVQMMAAGTGILHSEVNPLDDQALKLFQIWIIPREEGLKPGYQQMQYEIKHGGITWLVSPLSQYEGQSTLRINQDAYLGVVEFSENYKQLNLTNPLKGLGTYILNIDGKIKVNSQVLSKRDAYGHWDELTTISGEPSSKALIIQVPAI